MRLLDLLVIFLFSLTFVGVAAAADQSGQSSSAPLAQANLLQPPSDEVIPDVVSLSRDSGYDLIHPNEIHPNFRDSDLVRPYRYSPGMSDGDSLCYAMRSYFMEREARDSDVTSPAGYATCQKASRFAVKLAVNPLEPAPR
jgi:hypothetical protein